MKKIPRVSYNSKKWADDGTVHQQRITIDRRTYEYLTSAIESEISLEYPREKRYAIHGGNFLERLSKGVDVENRVIYINSTQTEFINIFLKLPLKKKYNSYLVIE